MNHTTKAFSSSIFLSGTMPHSFYGKMQKWLIGFLVIAFSAYPSHGQTQKSIVGQVKDEKGEAISYANIAILSVIDSSLVTGDVTDEAGRFQINSPKTGNYILKSSAIGFGDIIVPFEVTGSDFKKDFGVIILKEDIQQLNEVKISSLRPTIVNEVDKMVVSVEGTALAAGSSAFDILSKAPGVWIDQDGNVQLNGKAGVHIMIDGRPTYLSAKELQNMLEGMSADNIKNIEIISNPSSRFDAEGTSGVINITLKKNQLTGFNGSVYAGYEFRAMHGYSGGTNVNFKKGKWSSYAHLDMAKRPWRRTSEMKRAFNDGTASTTFDQEGQEDVIRYTPSVRLGTDFDINSKNSIGVMMRLSALDGSQTFKTTSLLRNGDPNSNMRIDAVNNTNYLPQTGTFNLHFTRKPDSLGTVISADLNYVRLNNDGDADYFNKTYRLENNALVSQELLTSDNPTHYDIYAAKIDLERPIKNIGKLEAGLKASYIESDNKLNFYKVENGNKIRDTNRSNHFIYKENIYAGYANFSAKLNDSWSLQAGLRAEHTSSEGHSVTLDTITARDYFDLFPSVFVQQKVSNNYQIGYNYSRRINRPNYESLNPFIYYLDPYTWAQGNPLLKPQYTNSFEIRQTWKNSYNLILDYAISKDYMAEVPEQNNEDKTTVFSQRNVDDFKNIGATLVAPIQITKSWATSNTLIVAYQQFSTILNELDLQNDQVFFMAQTTHNFILPQNIKMELNAGYQGPLAHGLYRIESQWWVDLGVKRSFLNEKLDLSLNITDIFRTRQVIGSANIDGNINSFDQYFSAQSFRVNLRYMFNKGEKFEIKNKGSNLEELNRAGG